jgi:hypothetical protein
MTETELQAWGKQEHEIRLDDIARAKAGMISLEDAQAAAKLRRRRAGLSLTVCDQALRLARVARS